METVTCVTLQEVAEKSNQFGIRGQKLVSVKAKSGYEHIFEYELTFAQAEPKIIDNDSPTPPARTAVGIGFGAY